MGFPLSDHQRRERAEARARLRARRKAAESCPACAVAARFPRSLVCLAHASNMTSTHAQEGGQK